MIPSIIPACLQFLDEAPWVMTMFDRTYEPGIKCVDSEGTLYTGTIDFLSSRYVNLSTGAMWIVNIDQSIRIITKNFTQAQSVARRGRKKQKSSRCHDSNPSPERTDSQEEIRLLQDLETLIGKRLPRHPIGASGLLRHARTRLSQIECQLEHLVYADCANEVYNPLDEDYTVYWNTYYALKEAKSRGWSKCFRMMSYHSEAARLKASVQSLYDRCVVACNDADHACLKRRRHKSLSQPAKEGHEQSHRARRSTDSSETWGSSVATVC